MSPKVMLRSLPATVVARSMQSRGRDSDRFPMAPRHQLRRQAPCATISSMAAISNPTLYKSAPPDRTARNYRLGHNSTPHLTEYDPAQIYPVFFYLFYHLIGV